MREAAFVQRLVEWQPFYTAVATVAATLVGLLFVALSINREKLAAKENLLLRRLALRTFGDYLFVLGVAMVMLVPKQGPGSVALTLFGLGLLRVIRIVRQGQHPAYRHAGPRRPLAILKEYALPLGSGVGLCAVGVAVGLGHDKAIYFLVLILLELVSTASAHAWRLLMLDELVGEAP